MLGRETAERNPNSLKLVPVAHLGTKAVFIPRKIRFKFRLSGLKNCGEGCALDTCGLGVLQDDLHTLAVIRTEHANCGFQFAQRHHVTHERLQANCSVLYQPD